MASSSCPSLSQPWPSTRTRRRKANNTYPLPNNSAPTLRKAAASRSRSAPPASASGRGGEGRGGEEEDGFGEPGQVGGQHGRADGHEQPAGEGAPAEADDGHEDDGDDHRLHAGQHVVDRRGGAVADVDPGQQPDDERRRGDEPEPGDEQAGDPPVTAA